MGIDIVIVMYACQPLIFCRDWYGLKNSPFLKKNRNLQNMELGKFIQNEQSGVGNLH